MSRRTAPFETAHAKDSGIALHCHETPYVTLVMEGRYVEVFENLPRVLRPGSVIAHTSGEEHSDHFSAGTRCLNVHLAHCPPDGAMLRDDCVAAARRVIRAYSAADAVGLRGAIAELEGKIAARPPEDPRPHWLEQALRAPEWTEAIPLSELAERCGVHPAHFSRDFQRCMGDTPSKHRRKRRVELASALLLESQQSLAQIASACGFYDQSHLNRAFAVELGMSPGKFQRVFSR